MQKRLHHDTFYIKTCQTFVRSQTGTDYNIMKNFILVVIQVNERIQIARLKTDSSFSYHHVYGMQEARVGCCFVVFKNETHVACVSEQSCGLVQMSCQNRMRTVLVFVLEKRI